MAKDTAHRPENPAFEGDETPMHPDEVTLGRLERETGETREQVAVRGDAPSAARSELPVEERRARHIEDNVRHVDSIGRR